MKVGGTANPAMIPRVRAEIDAAARGAGRDPGGIGVAVGAVTVVARDGAAGRRRSPTSKAALYLPVIAELDPTLGVEPERLARIRHAAAAYDFDTAAREVPDALLRRVAFAGTPDDVAAQAAACFAAGAGRVEFGTPHGVTDEEGLRLLGEAVLPMLREALHA